MDIDQVQAGEYELVAELFDQPLSKPGEPFNFKRYVRGDKVTLNVEEARRLYSAGAVVEPGARERALVEQARLAYQAALALLPPEPESVPVPTPAEPAESKPLSEMTVDELTAYAAAAGIDIGRATTEDGIRAKILEAEQA